jgi:glycosyltransferase involved in cell wall biosynthesis
MSPEKGPLEAIEVAERTGVPLKMVAKVNSWESDYFESQIRPRLRSPLIEFVGELDETAKNELLAGAGALLFPIDWEEPFGMVLVESMALGTPVLAFRRGAVAEIVEDGVTGFTCSDAASMAKLVDDVIALDRARCRDRVGARFSASNMADCYEAAYARALGQT